MTDGLPVRRAGLRVEAEEGIHRLYDRTGRALGELNFTAAALWELCDGTTSPLEMIQAICAACAVDEPAAARDVTRALADMAAAGLID
ncbi:MAG: PqqD family protein [Acidimicrobiales bacterium]